MAFSPEFKVILLGDPGVGKTTFFLRLKEGEFVDTEVRPTASLGVERIERTVTVDGVDVKVRRGLYYCNHCLRRTGSGSAAPCIPCTLARMGVGVGNSAACYLLAYLTCIIIR